MASFDIVEEGKFIQLVDETVTRGHSLKLYKPRITSLRELGVTLAQLVKASVGQADVQRFEPHLGHN